MKKFIGIALAFSAVPLVFAQAQAPVAGRELSGEGKSKEFAEARAKRNALALKNNATVINLYDRYGKIAGTVGEKALYSQMALSPDRSHVAVVKEDLDNESDDIFVLDVATGAATRITTSARTEFVISPVWSPDGKRLAYTAMRSGHESVFIRAADGQGPEELVYNNPGAFWIVSDWSKDGRFLSLSFSDLKGGTIYLLPLEPKSDRKPLEIYHTDLRVFGPRFSPDSRYLAYSVIDKANQVEIFVRPATAAGSEGPWQLSAGALGSPWWRKDGKELTYIARDRSVMTAEVSTAPSFTFSKPKVLFRPPGAVPDFVATVSADGERFLTLPPALGQQLRQLTVFNREGQVVRKVGEPGLYNQAAFSPDGKRLLVMKNDLSTSRQNVWIIDLDTEKAAQLTNDTRPIFNPLWSPDGKYVYYASLRDDYWPVFRRPADGSGAEEMVFRYTPGAGVVLTDIVPDGKSIICESGGVILTVPLTGTDPVARKEIETLREEFDDSTGRISPDGRFLAFRSDEAKPERMEVYVRPYDAATGKVGNAKWQISKDGVNAMLHWREDGKEVFFRGQELNSSDLVLVSVELETTPEFRASAPKVLFRLPGPMSGNLQNISRDGQRFVFAVNVPANVTTH
jgi:Tol biopolymer transport system component